MTRILHLFSFSILLTSVQTFVIPSSNRIKTVSLLRDAVHVDSNDEKIGVKSELSNSSPRQEKIEEEEETKQPLTSAVLRISYDGSRFTGWSAANTGDDKSKVQKLTRPSRRHRRRGIMGDIPNKNGFVRPVEGIIRDNLAKIYGNVDPSRIIVEGCSRTDKGVHSQGMIAQFYCLKEGILDRIAHNDTSIHYSIEGKRKPHPISPKDDDYFEPVPMNGDLSRLAFALNRMRPQDVQISGIAPTPFVETYPFHPSLTSIWKTYEYRISIGGMYDPTMQKLVWHVSRDIDIDAIRHACTLLEGKQDFSAFQGAPRGQDDKQRRSEQSNNPSAAVCNLHRVDIVEVPPPIDAHYFPGLESPPKTYKIVVTGDRFLYKMVRFLVGALVAVGKGTLSSDDISRALRTGNWNFPNDTTRRKQFQCAPAKGLVLHSVDFGEEISMQWQPLRNH